MKKAFIVLCALAQAALFIPSCQKAREGESSCPPGQTITFRARLPEQDGDATKAGFGTPIVSAYPVLWDRTDVAAVTVDYAVKPVSAAITPLGNARTGTFSATLGVLSSESTVQAVVPEWALVSYNTDDKDITLNIPASQTPLTTGPDPKAIQLVANQGLDAVSATDTLVELPFHHATAYGCVTLKNLPTEAEIHSIDLIFSVPVTGKWKYKPSVGSMTVDVPANIITLHTSTASEVFFGCAPAMLEGQALKVRLNTSAGIWEKTVNVMDDRQLISGVLANFIVDMNDAYRKTSIKLLSIGNSFSLDAHEYLWDIIKSSGDYDNIVLGNLYLGGGTLSTHVKNHVGEVSEYTYYLNETGKRTTLKEYDLLTALTGEDWDYITLQQASGSSGIASTYYPYLDLLIDIVRAICPEAKLLWHMTWAYQQDCTLSAFSKYGNDQMVMYEAILSVVEDVVVPCGAISEALPVGTAIQNLRTSPLGDTLTRDGCHLSKLGCFAAGLMWYRALTGKSIDDISDMPHPIIYTEEELLYIKDAIEKAYWNPYTIIPYVMPFHH